MASGYDGIECVYQYLAGLAHLDAGITELEKLPQAAREYLAFLEKESDARIGMVSTGPGREQTMFADSFIAALKGLTGQKTELQQQSDERSE